MIGTNKKIAELIKYTYIAFDKYYLRLKKENRSIFAYIEISKDEEKIKDEYTTLIVQEVTSKKVYTFINC